MTGASCPEAVPASSAGHSATVKNICRNLEFAPRPEKGEQKPIGIFRAYYFTRKCFIRLHEFANMDTKYDAKQGRRVAVKCPKCGFVSFPGLVRCKQCGHQFVDIAKTADETPTLFQQPREKSPFEDVLLAPRLDIQDNLTATAGEHHGSLAATEDLFADAPDSNLNGAPD